jgi:hypothetical protein
MVHKKFERERKSIREHYQANTENFVGTGLGDSGDKGDSCVPCIKVYVTKLTEQHKNGKHKFGDGSEVNVKYVEVGEIQPMGFMGRYRPVQPGAIFGSVGSALDGTVGAVLTDNTDGKKVLLGTSHVLVNWNTLPVGTAVLQPGPNTGGNAAADQIGTVKRMVPIDFTQGGINYVDAAIVKPTTTTIYSVTPFCASVKPTKQGAIGMLWAASTAITIICPISNITALLNVSVPKQKVAAPGMSIHGCSAFSGYVTTSVFDVMVDLLLSTGQGTSAWFLDQITCAGGFANSLAGDSGTMMYTTFSV